MGEIIQRNDRGETESQPLILPFTFRQLQDSASVTVKREFNCCWSVYSVTCPDAGTLFTLEGIHGYSLKDINSKKLAQIHRSLPIFTPYTLRVVTRDTAPISIGAQTRGSQVVLIQDGRHTVLRIRKPQIITHETEFEIMSNTTNTRIGMVTKDGSEYEVQFPNDIDVRYKTALIAACVYLDALPTKRPTPLHADYGARPVSNTYVNFQDTLFNSLRISETFASYSST